MTANSRSARPTVISTSRANELRKSACLPRLKARDRRRRVPPGHLRHQSGRCGLVGQRRRAGPRPGPVRPGSVPAFGAQGFPGFRPDVMLDQCTIAATTWPAISTSRIRSRRTSISTSRVRLPEHYSDAGSTNTGKIAAHLQGQQLAQLPRVLQRRFPRPGTAAAGILHDHVLEIILTVNGVTGPYEVKTFQVNNPAAIALGATPLKPEQSHEL